VLPPVVFPPHNWINQDIIVYHGTVDTFAAAIVSGPIVVGRGKPNTDFGPGFYTTTLKRQAHMWAAQISATRPGTSPAVIEITINRLSLAGLDTLSFVRGDFDADDYWSLIHHCRKGALDHGRALPRPYYDVVYGPVAAFWNQRMIIADADQISFHTSIAEAVLKASVRRRII
jgi:Protein of unknown function (DUF3990)